MLPVRKNIFIFVAEDNLYHCSVTFSHERLVYSDNNLNKQRLLLFSENAGEFFYRCGDG